MFSLGRYVKNPQKWCFHSEGVEKTRVAPAKIEFPSTPELYFDFGLVFSLGRYGKNLDLVEFLTYPPSENVKKGPPRAQG